MLQLKKITKTYVVGEQKIKALRGIDIEFSKNEFVSVLGPSGCGKTTLMNIIGGLDKYTSGELIINDISTVRFADKDFDNYRNKRVGFVFQSYNLIPHLSVLGNIEIALTISGMSKAERRKRALSAVEQVGLTSHMNQRPNQLSGGQMQRVAIARALVNSPEILLADEPTGALDTATSAQIMELMREVAKDKLVIMVTHNPELAQQYSTRIIKMVDGLITEDTANTPTQAEASQQITPLPPKPTGAKENVSMHFLTALSLSAKNLLTKKGRTIMTSVAGSIGIVGIALILALSGGTSSYINKMQRDMLASSPISITDTTIDMTQAMNAMRNRETRPEFPNIKEILAEQEIRMEDISVSNNINQQYIDFLESQLNPDWYNDIIYKTGLRLNIYGILPNATNYSEITANSTGRNAWQMMLNEDFINGQYDVLEGTFPKNKNEVAIIVSSSNQMSVPQLIALGFKTADDDIDSVPFSEVIGKQYKAVSSKLLYRPSTNNGNPCFVKRSASGTNAINFDEAETLTVSCVLRINKETDNGVMSNGVGYLKELYTFMQDEGLQSDIVQYMNDNPLNNPLDGVQFTSSGTTSAETLRADMYRSVGGNAMPNEISIYPTSFNAKESIKQMLNSYNTDKEKEDMVTYFDMSDFIGASIGTVINVITWVLVGFTAISLVVSSIMIGIITYVSVLERTKEIGVLRSIGARKKDITRVFNAETTIIGAVAGVLGVLSAYLFSVPINLIINHFVGVRTICSLNPLYALLLVAISVALTLVSGLIPSYRASKKDPVLALRTE